MITLANTGAELAKTSPNSLSVDFDLVVPWAYRQGARIRGNT